MAKRPRLKNASGDGKLASKSDDATGVSPAKSVSPQNGLLSNWFKPIDKEENLDSIMTVKNETLNNDKSMEVRELLQVSCGSQQLVQKPEISSDSKTPRLRQRRKVLKSVESGSESVPEVSVALNNDKIQRKDKIRFSRKVKTVFITPLPGVTSFPYKFKLISLLIFFCLDKKPGFVRMPVSPSVTDENLMASATLINAKMPFTVAIVITVH